MLNIESLENLLVVKKSDWPTLSVTDGRFVQSPSRIFFLKDPLHSAFFLWALCQMDM